MKVCRFQQGDSAIRLGLVADDTTVLDLTPAGLTTLQAVLEADDPVALLQAAARGPLPRLALAGLRLLPPVERQEVWAAGVTYLRSKAARMEESDFSALAYDHIYTAERPEIFFKALGEKAAGPGGEVGIRRDARWNVPEPELTLVVNSRGSIAGCTIGIDMSSRDIEGENLLYLPQAKIYDRSCALGPWITLGATEAEVRTWVISLTILRGGRPVFAGETSAGQIKRSFADLAAYLCRSQTFPHGAMLLTGTGVVPPDDFTLQAGDVTEIVITGIGRMRNTVVVV